MRTHTLVVGDTHFGRQICRTGPLLSVLNSVEHKRLIVVGDLCERGNGFSNDEFSVLAYLRENNRKLICIKGNHDPHPKESIWRVIGVKPADRFVWEAGGRRFCAMHGHQFDRFCFVFNEQLIDRMFLAVVSFLRRIDRRRNHVASWMDAMHEKLSLHAAKKAKRYAKRHGFDVMVCGHTHREVRFLFRDPKNQQAIEYINCGSWVDEVCSYVTIGENGAAELHFLNSGEAMQ